MFTNCNTLTITTFASISPPTISFLPVKKKNRYLDSSPPSFIGSNPSLFTTRDNPIPCASFWGALFTDNPFQISLPCVSHHWRPWQGSFPKRKL
ncbi:hypothetical protein CDAR_397511 [Caerostris darwini]|uniref:Uncharacterized protein n=1 Tax=Caerostris darwini TaxID=1538125 RepID=A0AAV4TA22_9ARAC|nr:hypothetical protein CDAR_397511 [Caerostris darwini]